MVPVRQALVRFSGPDGLRLPRACVASSKLVRMSKAEIPDRGAPRMSRAAIPILSYHQVDRPPPRGTPVRSLVLPPWRLAAQLQALRALGWQGLSMRELQPYLRGERHGKVVGITFDDGYRNNLRHALPVLQRLGFSATVFMVSGQLGGTNAWDHALGVPASPLMTAAELREWIDAGMEVGSHTRNHVNLAQCDDATAREEITGSRLDLEDVLGVPVRSFCYPYGGHRPEHAEMVREAGYTSATTIVSARTREGDDMFRLPRVSVELDDPIARTVLHVATPWLEWRARRRGAAAMPAAC
jgi:peptidoglycan/xylan/chitin deacetylase (PgdA/CDA1 family)